MQQVDNAIANFRKTRRVPKIGLRKIVNNSVIIVTYCNVNEIKSLPLPAVLVALQRVLHGSQKLFTAGGILQSLLCLLQS